MSRETVGLVGIGLLGAAIAERLLEAGYGVVGYDVDAARRNELRRLGGNAVEQAKQVAARCPWTILCLPDSNAVGEVVEQLRPLRPPQTVIDTTTGDPLQTAALGRQLTGAGVNLLDASVLGSSEQMRRGEAIVMVGGSQAAYRECRHLFAALASQTFHLGPCGSGGRMKLVANLVLGLNRAALAEGLHLAAASGLDQAAVLAVLRSGAAYSRIMDGKGEKMLRGDFSPQARLSQHLKDVDLMLSSAEHAGTRLPLTETHRDLLQRAAELGWGAHDNSAVLNAWTGKGA